MNSYLVTIIVALACLFSIVSADLVSIEARGSFGYDDNELSIAGPSKWGNLPLSAICKTGLRQSPIDIPFPSPVSRSNGPISLAYKPSLVNIANHGYSFVVSSRSRYLEHSIMFVQNLVYAPLGYRLFDMHMHWGRNNTEGSEHSLAGQFFPLEAHFVHYNSRFSSIDAAVRSGDHDALIVIGVFFRVGTTTPPSISKILSKAPYFTAVTQETEIDEPIDLSDIYPKRLEYFTYLGSFTTPRCNQAVRWLVLARPVSIRQEDLDIIRSVNLILSLTTTGPGHNFRPLQAIGTRKVTSSFSSLPTLPSDPVAPVATPTPTPTPLPQDPDNNQPLEG